MCIVIAWGGDDRRERERVLLIAQTTSPDKTRTFPRTEIDAETDEMRTHFFTERFSPDALGCLKTCRLLLSWLGPAKWAYQSWQSTLRFVRNNRLGRREATCLYDLVETRHITAADWTNWRLVESHVFFFQPWPWPLWCISLYKSLGGVEKDEMRWSRLIACQRILRYTLSISVSIKAQDSAGPCGTWIKKHKKHIVLLNLYML